MGAIAVSLVGLRAYFIFRGVVPPWVTQKHSFSKLFTWVDSFSSDVSGISSGKSVSLCPFESSSLRMVCNTFCRILNPYGSQTPQPLIG